MPKLWGGRFSGETDPHFASFNSSFRFDRRLLSADIRGSIAQAAALGRAGIIDQNEAREIVNGLEKLLELSKDPAYIASPEFADAEDVHSFIEARLVELIGPSGYKLHTGRSRNDQVATATRIFLRDEIDRIDHLIREVEAALVKLAERYKDDPIPGYTHLQKAQPVLFAHFLLAYFEMLERDRARLTDTRRRTNVCPLGSGALSGTGFGVDREWIAAELGFDGVTHNSLDAVSDRDYVIEFIYIAANTMMHLSRLAEDLIIYSTQEFGFIKLGDAIATGSSLMPQKKNPDSLELIRGKAGRVFGHLMAMLTVSKGLPLAYNKDFQEDKEALFDTVDTLSECLRVTVTVLRNVELDTTRAKAAAESDYTDATDLADYLVRRGLEFRNAHEIVGRVVIYALENGKQLRDLRLEELREFSTKFDEDVFAELSLEKTLSARAQTGGTSPERVRDELIRASEILSRGQDVGA